MSSLNSLPRRGFLTGTALGAASLATGGLWTPARAALVEPAAAAPTVAPGAAPAATPTTAPAAAASGWAGADAIRARVKAPSFPARDFAITAYGANGNGKADNTAAIKRAIAACNAAGGGRVVVPAGTFLTGAVTLLSNVNLYVAKGAVLKFSTDPKAYLPVVLTRWEGNDCYNYSPLIYAFRQTNVAVTGEGTLDGQASNQKWWYWSGAERYGWRNGLPKEGPDSQNLRAQAERAVPVKNRVYGPGHYLRPSFVQPYGCKNVLIEGVTIKGAPMWVMHPLLCTNVTVRKVKVASLGSNNDGIDVESCTDVVVENCTFDTGDDCVVLKSGRGRDGIVGGTPTANVVVSDCHMRHGIGGMTIGSEMSGDVRNVYVEDLVLDSPSLAHVLYVKSNTFRGGTAENIYMRNVKAVGCSGPAMYFTYFYAKQGLGGPYKPVFRDINVANVTCGKSPVAISMRGYPNNPIRDISFNNCTFTGAGKPLVKENATDINFTNVRTNGKPL